LKINYKGFLIVDIAYNYHINYKGLLIVDTVLVYICKLGALTFCYNKLEI